MGKIVREKRGKGGKSVVFAWVSGWTHGIDADLVVYFRWVVDFCLD